MRTTLTRFLPACLAVLSPLLLTQSRQPAPLHEIAFDFTTRQPIAPVRVNGGQPVPFLFDTGASINVIDDRIARAAGVSGTGSQTMTGGGEGTAQATFADALVLEGGGVRWERQRAAVLALGYPERKHYAGFIGAPILMRYVVQFDFTARVMRLIDPRAYTVPAGAVVVPFELQADLPVVRARVDAGNGLFEARLMVDTGASTFVDLNRPFVDAHQLVESMPDAAAAARPAGIGGTAPFVYGTGRHFALGGMTFDRPRLGLSRATQGSSSRSERDGIIGNALLAQFTATFDYQRRTLVLERNGTRQQKD